MSYVATAVTSMAVAYVAIRLLIPVLRRRGVLDVPNDRSSHLAPTPRGGGFGVVLALFAGIVVAEFTGAGHLHWTILLATAGIAACGAADDLLHGVHPGVRLMIQILMAVLVVLGRGGLPAVPLPAPLDLPLGAVGSLAAVLWIIVVTNVYNFLDGIDGFAGAQALVAGIAVAVIAPDSSIAAVGIIVASAAVGFLAHNWHPARIFMGDAGSTTVGFLLAVVPFEAGPELRPQLVFSIFLFLWFFLSDGMFTLGRRLLRGDAIWKAHRSHLYQQLAAAGIAHDVIVLRVIGMAAVVTLVTVTSAKLENAMFSWVSLSVALVLFAIYVSWSERIARE